MVRINKFMRQGQSRRFLKFLSALCMLVLIMLEKFDVDIDTIGKFDLV